MSNQTTSLRDEIRLFLEETGMSSSYFGKRAAGNSELVSRLEMGRTVTLPTAERIRRFIAERRARLKRTHRANGGVARH
jgi:hypothetical protein